MTLLKMSRIRAQISTTNFGIRSFTLSDDLFSFSIITYLLRIPAVRVRFINCPFFTPIRSNLMYSKKVQSNSPMNDFVDPRFEDDAIAALMEDALTETRDDKFDVEKFIEGDLDY